MPELTMDEWEALCRRCGQCCFEKWIGENGDIRFTRIPCRHLDMITRECRVYLKRLDVDEGCVRLTPDNVEALGWLPSHCAYLWHLRGEAPEPRRRQRPSRKRDRRA